MKYVSLLALAIINVSVSSCSLLRSGGDGITGTEISTYTESINRYDLDIDPEYVTYTIDISTPEGRLALHGLTLEEARQKVLTDAAIKYRCTKIFGPKFSHLKKGKQILRITVSGQPARYKNSQKTATPDKEPQKNNIIIVK